MGFGGGVRGGGESVPSLGFLTPSLSGWVVPGGVSGVLMLGASGVVGSTLLSLLPGVGASGAVCGCLSGGWVPGFVGR